MKFLLPLVIQSLTIFFVSAEVNVVLPNGFDKDVIQPMNHPHQLLRRHLDPMLVGLIEDYMDWFYCAWETYEHWPFEYPPYWPYEDPECMSQQYGQPRWVFLVNGWGNETEPVFTRNCTDPFSNSDDILIPVFILNGYLSPDECDDPTEPDCVCVPDDSTSCDDITNSCSQPGGNQISCCGPPGPDFLGTCKKYFDIYEATHVNTEGSNRWQMENLAYASIFVDGIEENTFFFENVIYTLNPPCSLSVVQAGKEASIQGYFAILRNIKKGRHEVTGSGGMINPDDPDGDPLYLFKFKTTLEIV